MSIDNQIQHRPYRVFQRNKLGEIPQVSKLSAAQKEEILAVSAVLPFRVNSYVLDELIDWTDVDAAEQLFADILDPNTGEPVLVQATTVLVMPAYRHTAHRVFNAAEIQYTADSAATTTVAANPLGNNRVVESRLAYRRIVASGEAAADAKKWWFIGDFKKAFAYMENWPITVTQAPPNSEAEFNQDIVVRFKASERGAAAVINPRYVVKSTGAGSGSGA